MNELQDRIAAGIHEFRFMGGVPPAYKFGTNAELAGVAVAVTRQAIEEIHHPIAHDPHFCAACTTSWPCATVALFGPAPTDGEEG